jgi:DNA-binding GntR family transcriptional regulator
VPVVAPSVSAEQTAYVQMRDDIVHLRLTPGERLILDVLADRYAVSATPIRQALRRLESDGLVVSSRNRGARVAPLSIEDVEEIQAIRLGVTLLLARWGAERCTDEVIATMDSRLEEMGAAVSRDDHDAYLAAYAALRFAFHACAQRPHLERVLAESQFRMDRYTRAVDLAHRAGSFVSYSWNDARYPMRMLDACRARDGHAAQQVSLEAAQHVLDELRRLIGPRERLAIAL